MEHMVAGDFAKRPANPKRCSFTARDGLILEAIHAYEGMLSDRQVMRLFFHPETGLRQAQKRLNCLWENGYIRRPKRHWGSVFRSTVYFLDEKGAAYVAGLRGERLAEFKWRREPRWSLIRHDLKLNDFRISATKAIDLSPQIALEHPWVPSSGFWSNPDEVEYRNHNGRLTKRQVRPDGYFGISYAVGGRQLKFRFIVEVDRETEDNPRIARDKILPGIAYLRSSAYKARFGANVGKFLFVTTGRTRAQHMKEQAERAVGEDARFFYFTWFDQVKPETVFEPIWYRGGADKQTSPIEVAG